jgi:hypothetical protein
VASLVAMGAIGSVLVLGAAGATALVVASVLEGEFAVLALFAAAAVLLGRRLAVHAALAEHTDGWFTGAFSRRELLAASVGWAVALVALAVLDAPREALFACFVVAVFGLLPVVAALSSEGVVDTDADELRVGGRDVPLAAVDRVTSHAAGPVVVLRVHYHAGAGSPTAPRFLGVASADAERVREAIQASTAPPPDASGNPAVEKTLYAFGLGALAVAAGLAYHAAREGGDAGVVVGYAAAVAALFGAVFLWLGALEG